MVKVTDLLGQRWVSVPPGNICHDCLMRTVRAAGQEPDIRYQVGEFQTQMVLIAAGLGVGLVPRPGRGPLPAGVVARPVEPEPTRRVLGRW